jgi:hypothetical protein
MDVRTASLLGVTRTIMTQMRPSWIAIALVLGGCKRDPDYNAEPAPPPPAAATPAAIDAGPGCRLADNPSRRPATGRIVAVGDLHGDLTATRAALRVAGVIDPHDRWIGGTTTLVQTGDVLDRGDDEHAILDLIGRLETEAHLAGGAYIMLLGNHELMNAAGDFRYVTPAGTHDFDDMIAAAPPPSSTPDRVRGRLAALGAGGPYARRLAEHAIVAIVGDTLFSHAGVLGRWVTRVDELNQSARCWMDGQSREPPAALTSSDSPVWTRAAGEANVDCAAVRAALDALRVQRMVVGHTVQQHGITSACDGALWRIDVGLATYYGGPIQVLEIVPGPAKVITGTRG